MKNWAAFILALMVLISGAAILVVSTGGSPGFIVMSLGAVFLVQAGLPRPRQERCDPHRRRRAESSGTPRFIPARHHHFL